MAIDTPAHHSPNSTVIYHDDGGGEANGTPNDRLSTHNYYDGGCGGALSRIHNGHLSRHNWICVSGHWHPQTQASVKQLK